MEALQVSGVSRKGSQVESRLQKSKLTFIISQRYIYLFSLPTFSLLIFVCVAQ